MLKKGDAEYSFPKNKIEKKKNVIFQVNSFTFVFRHLRDYSPTYEVEPKRFVSDVLLSSLVTVDS